MSPEKNSQNTKICPTCGTRLSENATRCLVCGRTFTPTAAATSAKPAVQGPRMPEVTLSLPLAIGLVVLVLGVGAAIVFGVLRGTGRVTEPTPSPSPTTTATITVTPSPTLTPSPVPSFTPLPPVEYTVQQNDTCLSIAYTFKVSVASIVLLNNLPAECNTLSVGQKLQVPQPTPTPSPMPTSTLSSSEATVSACQTVDYTVKSGDTLGGIARNYNVEMDAIKAYNPQISGEIVYEGQALVIPLCKRLPTAGPTPTATPPPPYAAPNLLLPADGAFFLTGSDTITLQWAAVGTLRDNEAYQVTVEDVTDGTGRRLVEYVTDTKFIVPSSFRPSGSEPHIFRWTITPVRQVGSNKEGQPLWAPGGAVSAARAFSWIGTGGQAVTPTP